MIVADDRAAWLDALRRRDTADLLALVNRCPSSDARDTARAMAPGHDAVSLLALASLAQTLLVASNGVFARDLAGAVGEVACAAFDSEADAQLLVVAEWTAEIETGSVATLASGQEIVDSVVQWLMWLEGHGSRAKSCVLALTAAEARMDEGLPEAASAWLALADASPVENWAVNERREIVRRRLSSALKKATELPLPFTGPTNASLESLSSQLAFLRDHMKSLPPAQRVEAAAVLERMEAGLAKNPPDLFAAGSELQALQAAFGTPSDAAGSLREIRQGYQRVMSFLQDPVRSQDRVALGDCIADAERIRAAAQGLGLVSEQDTMDWAIAVCRQRRREYATAVDVLQRLWGSLEVQRATIRDRVRRAGVFAAFPCLFVTLADALYEAGRQHELLEVVEAGKGRLLEDLLLIRDASSLAPTAKPAAEAWPLPDRSHFLSFLVADDCTFAVLLAGDGSRHATRIELPRDVLRAYAASVDPSTWGRSLGGIGNRRPADLPDRLAPLVSWLEPLMQGGVIAADDHLCYSPDDELHLIPLHILTFAGKALVETLSVSRLQAAKVMWRVLNQPPVRPRRGCAVDVPADDEDPINAVAFRDVGDRLGRLLPSERLSGAEATLDTLAGLQLDDRVVHFTTHGTFPKHEQLSVDPNPFRSSGPLLATRSGLPSRSAVASGRSLDGLLSPEQLGSLSFRRSHVTTQACSSGLARDGAGGDALGIELALLMQGASSVLTTHWDVELGPSNDFCGRFYEGWLGQGLTRAQAWRKALLSMKDEGRPPYEWAAFSLAGDWR